ncbi:MAG: hypothetical protein M0Z46_20050 [Actinomycetota bacterium]|nr:hypothetical protein [Actinomycetota bacterium]
MTRVTDAVSAAVFETVHRTVLLAVDVPVYGVTAAAVPDAVGPVVSAVEAAVADAAGGAVRETYPNPRKGDQP